MEYSNFYLKGYELGLKLILNIFLKSLYLKPSQITTFPEVSDTKISTEEQLYAQLQTLLTSCTEMNWGPNCRLLKVEEWGYKKIIFEVYFPNIKRKVQVVFWENNCYFRGKNFPLEFRPMKHCVDDFTGDFWVLSL